MTQAICDITTDEVNVDVVVEPQANTMVEVANRAGGMEQVFHDNTLIGNGNSVDLGVNTDIIATKEYVDKNKVDAYTKTEVDNKVTVLNTGITGNAQAIQKTREDYIAADSEIHKTLNGHTAELTTLRGNQASLGVQVSNIEHKIPESASGSNPLITKQQLATKQDQLTAGDNIIISGNVISATGAGGGAGFDIVVVQELPATGQKGIIYLLAKDGAAPDVYDEYVWITATQTFELIGSTKVDLSDYVKKSGDTMSGGLTLPELTVRTAEGEFYVSVVAGVVTIATNNGLDFASHVKFDHAPTTDDNTTYADALDTSMVRKAQVATAIADAVNNIDALPDQTGNAGKVLTTDGMTASWQEPAGGTKVIFREWE